ncbi:protein canopy homolog 2-like [Homarus americanus]|uniref:Canopy 2-like n=1 Tax=Homarus americanus TaxID=6706 RepID=A0A8J5MYY6_HOMAM|nr:protein canopy homolog 2-like [Homarus americanus]KAG7168502.1 canopy 2-like [Homarus americanus]
MSSLVFQLMVLTLVVCSALSSKPPKSQVVKCAVCRSLVNEFHAAISEVDPRKKIDIGSYRIEADGKQKLSSVKYAGSEMHMLEMMETVCDNMKDYAQARNKETNKLEAIKLVVNGAMNPHFSEYEMVQDPELNKGLQFHCESIVEDFEDEVVAYFKDNSELDIKDSQEQFCSKVTKICVGVRDEL